MAGPGPDHAAAMADTTAPAGATSPVLDGGLAPADGARAPRLRRLAEELETAARSPGGGLTVSQPSLAGGQWRESVKLEIELRVDRDAGGMLAVEIVLPYKGPGPVQAIHRVAAAAPRSIELLALDIEHMFERWDGDPTVAWDIRQREEHAQWPVDEEWLRDPTAADLAARLGMLEASRGGCVAVAATEDPLTVVRLTVSGRSPNLQVSGRMQPLIGLGPAPAWRRRWKLGADPTAAGRILDEIARALQGSDPAAAYARSGCAGLGLRLESREAAREASEGGCGTLALVVSCTVVAGYVLYFLGWPQQGLIADVTTMTRESTSSRAAGGGLFIIAIALGVGAIPALLAGTASDWVSERLGLPYAIEGGASTVVMLAVYAVWVAAILLTPAWSVLVGSVIVPIVGLLAVGAAAYYGRRWLRRRSRRRGIR